MERDKEFYRLHRRMLKSKANIQILKQEITEDKVWCKDVYYVRNYKMFSEYKLDKKLFEPITLYPKLQLPRLQKNFLSSADEANKENNIVDYYNKPQSKNIFRSTASDDPKTNRRKKTTSFSSSNHCGLSLKSTNSWLNQSQTYKQKMAEIKRRKNPFFLKRNLLNSVELSLKKNRMCAHFVSP